MPFFLIKGTFHATNYSPDGDTIRFKADNETNWAKLTGPPIQLNGMRHASLRFEGVDALETHYNSTHQPLEQARAARNFVLENTGIESVQWNANQSRVIASQDGTAGYILTRAVEDNRRAVAFVFTGQADEPDGEAVILDGERIQQSLNCRLLEAGLVYPTYYEGLFSDLRQTLTAAVAHARENNLGVWPHDKTLTGVVVEGLQSIENDYPILPKLFRRMATYLEGGGSIIGFKEFLATNPDPLLVLSTGHFTNLDTIIEEQAQQIKMTELPEDVVFRP